jgi:hypothetical protein
VKGQGLREEFRTVIVRERGRGWWRRYRWAVEEKRYSDGWVLKESGFALTLKAALGYAGEASKPYSAKLARVEIATHVEQEPVKDRPARSTPLPPQILEPTGGKER